MGQRAALPSACSALFVSSRLDRPLLRVAFYEWHVIESSIAGVLHLLAEYWVQKSPLITPLLLGRLFDLFSGIRLWISNLVVYISITLCWLI